MSGYYFLEWMDKSSSSYREKAGSFNKGFNFFESRNFSMGSLLSKIVGSTGVSLRRIDGSWG
jgi:hypothetical protein